MRKPTPRDIALLCLLAAMWGGTFPAVKIAVTQASAMTVTAGRLLVAAVFVGIIASVAGHRPPMDRGVWLKYLATPEAMTAYAKAGGIPSMPKVLADNVSVNPVFGVIADQVAKYGYSPPLWSGTFDAMTQIIEALNPGWVRLTPNDEVLADANTKLQTLLDKK